MPFEVIVEGHGELKAVPNLLSRLGLDLRIDPSWKPPKRINVMRQSDAERVADLVSREADGVLVLRDSEDQCPVDAAPEMASWFLALKLPYPVACCLFYREYETLFLPCLEGMAGQTLGGNRPGVVPGTTFSGDPETPRDAKRVVTNALPANRTYKETIDQLALTRMIDFGVLRERALPSFGTLERALVFLTGAGAGPGQVFPIPVISGRAGELSRGSADPSSSWASGRAAGARASLA